MNIKKLIDTSKRMVMEYYNRYVKNIEDDGTVIDKITLSDISVISEEHNDDNFIELELQVSYDPWIVYHVAYDTQNDRLESYITLR